MLFRSDRPAGIRRLTSGAVVANGDTALVDLEEDGLRPGAGVHSECSGWSTAAPIQRPSQPWRIGSA